MIDDTQPESELAQLTGLATAKATNNCSYPLARASRNSLRQAATATTTEAWDRTYRNAPLYEFGRLVEEGIRRHGTRRTLVKETDIPTDNWERTIEYILRPVLKDVLQARLHCLAGKGVTDRETLELSAELPNAFVMAESEFEDAVEDIRNLAQLEVDQETPSEEIIRECIQSHIWASHVTPSSQIRVVEFAAEKGVTSADILVGVDFDDWPAAFDQMYENAMTAVVQDTFTTNEVSPDTNGKAASSS